ncbi:allantoate amidohydrolase [Sphingomonas crocodyli]|uniref:Allantoate amidohydrolase n=1 Tax=Sphingomonas crocodyli TaxID=1979270 RepID=A0A437LUZ2_9SPHN|nr:allantoate amidohydrolase [Sphingomonas crocodyli]RVT89178.1 allantoate amidohydrolase [Sphingomonas crocodyli]
MVTGGARAVARCDELGVAPYSDSTDGLFRAYLTPAHAASLDRLGGWMAEAGMSVRLDPAANLIGRYEGSDPDAPALLIGSHIDSVRDAGRYDGPLGIMLGVEAVAALGGRRLPFPIEVIAFGDEEGSRFPASMLCSRAVAGTLEAGAVDVADRDGVGLIDAISTFPDTSGDFYSSRYKSALAFLEPHIEQGPVLEAEGLALGVVSGIAAQLRYQVRISGKAGHAGTNAMHLRRDALTGAAEAVLAVERIAREAGGDVVATVGRMAVGPGAVNVVPGEVEFSIDVRSGDEALRDFTAQRIGTAIEAICGDRGLGLTIEQVQDLGASPCDPKLTALLEAALVEAGHPARTLVSGAGHDTMVMASLCPTAMLFIRCEGGVSHNPVEAVTAEDADAALQVIRRFIDKLGANYVG